MLYLRKETQGHSIFKLSECRSHLVEYAANRGERGERGERGFSCLGMPKS